ncbi:hypothetical protein OG223_32595 [Streptomyces sp. NBC_01478]|uniref:hypothetical protein n=1 Tax=Streptomyces sp. NBC_01478 TaxID=2903882 RepID=UPI002E31B290|nr:hypothetical protein [Streptomyces sp. NBC_01478]
MADHETGLPGPADTGLPALLGAALREGEVDGEAERRAVAAFVAEFKAARDAGLRPAPTRSQDDWRPRGSAP